MCRQNRTTWPTLELALVTTGVIQLQFIGHYIMEWEHDTCLPPRLIRAQPCQLLAPGKWVCLVYINKRQILLQHVFYRQYTNKLLLSGILFNYLKIIITAFLILFYFCCNMLARNSEYSLAVQCDQMDSLFK